MSVTCCHDARPPSNDPGYRTVLWAVLGINAAIFVVELLLGFTAGSVSLQADALDFLGDAANYSISLLVTGLALRRCWRTRSLLRFCGSIVPATATCSPSGCAPATT
jgi:Co/Zn/Cd efflux system component